VGAFGQSHLQLQYQETGELNLCITLQYTASDQNLTEEEEVAARAQVIILAGSLTKLIIELPTVRKG
jgi:phenylalanyl-tRNA synthetase beta subunit